MGCSFACSPASPPCPALPCPALPANPMPVIHVLHRILSFSRPFVPIFWLLQPTDPPPLASWVSFVSRVREQNRTASTHEEKRIVRVSRGVDGSRARQMRQRVEDEPNAPPVKPSAQGHGHHFWDALEMTMMGQECDIGCRRKAKKGAQQRRGPHDPRRQHERVAVHRGPCSYDE